MKKRFGTLIILSILITTLAACGVLQEPAAPSATIEAIPLDVETDEAAEEVAEEDAAPTEAPMEEPTEEPMEEPTEEPMEEPTEEPMEEPTEEPMEEPTGEPVEEAPATGGDLTVYTISQGESQVRFELDEDLRGSRITVVGTTDQVAGQFGINLADLSSAQVGVIQINARTLVTDNDFRNRAIQNEILQTGQYEFITFEPTAVTGLPDSAVPGEEISFTIEGNLTVRDVTQPATFDVTATAVSETQISGTATTVINREAYGLQIPSVPNVANVEEEVELYIDFVANAS